MLNWLYVSGRTACGKFALRGLSQCLAREFQPQGIHVAHIIIDGEIGSARPKEASELQEHVLNPDAIAQTYWQLHVQDRSAWTQEVDLRPFSERFWATSSKGFENLGPFPGKYWSNLSSKKFHGVVTHPPLGKLIGVEVDMHIGVNLSIRLA